MCNKSFVIIPSNTGLYLGEHSNAVICLDHIFWYGKLIVFIIYSQFFRLFKKYKKYELYVKLKVIVIGNTIVTGPILRETTILYSLELCKSQAFILLIISHVINSNNSYFLSQKHYTYNLFEFIAFYCCKNIKNKLFLIIWIYF